MPVSLSSENPGGRPDGIISNAAQALQSYCPVCENRQPDFKDFNGRKSAKCIHCGSLERHRSVWIYFKEKTDLFNKRDRKLLHFAPESCFQGRFSSFFRSGYLTVDLNMEKAMEKMDIMDIRYPDASFEIIYSSHVLEHVENYIRAIQELYRVLNTDGWMILLVPKRTEGKTYRFAEKSPSGHIWKFGHDFIDILEKTGFTVQLRTVSGLFTPAQIRSMGLKKKQEIFHCSK